VRPIPPRPVRSCSRDSKKASARGTEAHWGLGDRCQGHPGHTIKVLSRKPVRSKVNAAVQYFWALRAGQGFTAWERSREMLLRGARQTETASHMNEWLAASKAKR